MISRIIKDEVRAERKTKEKKLKSCSYFFTDGKLHEARQLDMITRDLECP